MGLEYIFALISILFFIGVIFFSIKKPKLIDKLEAVLICLLGALIYGFLAGSYKLGLSGLCVVLGITTIVFLMGLIYFAIKTPSGMKKWQAILIGLIGFLFYGALFGSLEYDEMNYMKSSNNKNVSFMEKTSQSNNSIG